uniref:CSON009250 protein n=1 Tax=Culicoides sonorensis TaxID=179676 RepID=A0A336LZZ8_CULSO
MRTFQIFLISFLILLTFELKWSFALIFMRNVAIGNLIALAIPLWTEDPFLSNVFMSYNFESNYAGPTSAPDITNLYLDKFQLPYDKFDSELDDYRRRPLGGVRRIYIFSDKIWIIFSVFFVTFPTLDVSLVVLPVLLFHLKECLLDFHNPLILNEDNSKFKSEFNLQLEPILQVLLEVHLAPSFPAAIPIIPFHVSHTLLSTTPIHIQLQLNDFQKFLVILWRHPWNGELIQC